jgi:NADH:ubiquinone oxidoreductase subunit F (NADH-binding)
MPVRERSRFPVEAPGLPRLLRGFDIPSFADHVECFGPLPRGVGLIEEVELAGLCGRGGAGFPTGRKLRAVAGGRRRAVLVANGTEGEPLSAKDRTLLRRAPHLVLDGMAAAADALGASRALLCVERDSSVLRALRAALAERVDRVPVELAETPPQYVAGQETALVRWIDGGDAKPVFSARPFESGVGRRPTLVDNVETFAHLGLIARFGAEWFRQVGTAAEPGSALVTVSGGVERSGIYEVAFDAPLDDLLVLAGASPARAVLIGGYFGAWVDTDRAAGLRLSNDGLACVGARFGCGVLAPVPEDVCALAEVARVSRWYAASSAGQCGVCVNGLSDIADAVSGLVAGDRGGKAEAALRRWTNMVRGRGGCQLPDGAAGFVDSALDVLAVEIDEHRRGACRRRQSALLPVPTSQVWR